MDRSSVAWYGYIPAITTPFDRFGTLDLTALDSQLDWLAEQRMSGIILAGTTGEWFSLTAPEREQLFRAGAERSSGSMCVIGGCNAFTAAEALAHARVAEACGLDGILLSPPPYVVPSRREVLAYYQAVSDGSGIPICVYNWPRGTGVDMDAELLAELAGITNVVAIKNSTGDFGSFLTGMYALESTVRYFGMPTNELGADLALLGHSDGMMGSGAPLGSDHPDFWRAIQDGDRAKAVLLGARDRVVMRSWFRPDYGSLFGNPQAIMKTALRLRGVSAGYVRDPLLELTAGEVARVRTTLEELGIETQPLP